MPAMGFICGDIPAPGGGGGAAAPPGGGYIPGACGWNTPGAGGCGAPGGGLSKENRKKEKVISQEIQFKNAHHFIFKKQKQNPVFFPPSIWQPGFDGTKIHTLNKV